MPQTPNRPPPVRVSDTDTPMTARSVVHDDSAEALDEIAQIRADLEALVSLESIPKDLALEIMKLHHKMEGCTTKMQTSYVREIDRLHHSLEQSDLKLEVNGLTLRQQVKEHEIHQLQSVNEQLQTLVNAAPPPSSRGRR